MDAADIAKSATKIAREARSLGRSVLGNPVAAVLTALAGGFVFGLVLRLFERPSRGREEK